MKKLFLDSEPKAPLSWIALLCIMLGMMFLSTWLIILLSAFDALDGLLVFYPINTFLSILVDDWPWDYLMPIGILVVTFFTRAGCSLGKMPNFCNVLANAASCCGEL